MPRSSIDDLNKGLGFGLNARGTGASGDRGGKKKRKGGYQRREEFERSLKAQGRPRQTKAEKREWYRQRLEQYEAEDNGDTESQSSLSRYASGDDQEEQTGE